VQKFQLVQTAHEVLSDPAKRATYDRTRGFSIKTSTSARTTPTASAPPTTPKTRAARTGATGFSKTTPKSSKPAFGYFTTREPPPSAQRKPPATAGFTKTTRPEKPFPDPPKHPAEAYFERFREQSNTTRNAYSSTARANAQRQKEAAQKAAGIKTPKREKTQQSRFGTTFDEDSPKDDSENDTFFSFSANGGSFTGTAGEKKEGMWSGRPSAYSHVFSGAKEDLRSPMKGTSTGFASDGFSPRKNGYAANTNGTPTANRTPKSPPEKARDPPIFSFTPGPALRKMSAQSQERRQSEKTTSTPHLDPNEIPKTPPPVEERRFASAFSRLNVDVNKVKPRSPPKSKEGKTNIDEWTKSFAEMNPFMSPGTKKLSEDKNFWTSAPLKSTPPQARSTKRPVSRPRSKRGGGLGDMDDLKRDLPKTETAFENPGVVPIRPVFTMDVPIPQGQAEPIFNLFGTSSVKPAAPEPTAPFRATQQPTPAASPVQPAQPTPNGFANFPQPPSPPVFTTPSIEEPSLNPPLPPKRLIPSIDKPKEFSFSVPPQTEMQLLAAEVQGYHTAYVMESSRFQEAWNKYETQIQFEFTSEAKVRQYLDLKEKLIKQRAEMESLHTLCLERWGSVAKFSGFAG